MKPDQENQNDAPAVTNEPQITQQPTREITQDISQTTTPPVTIPEPIAPLHTALPQMTQPPIQPLQQPPKKTYNKKIVILIIVIVSVMLLVLLTVGYLVFSNIVTKQDQSKLSDEQVAIAAKISTNSPVKDMFWKDLSKSVPGWTLLSTETGRASYALDGSSCGVLVDQPANLLSKNINSTSQIAEDFKKGIASQAGISSSDFSVTKTSPIIFNGTSANEQVGLSFDTYTMQTDTNDFNALIASYISGDYALIIAGLCGGEESASTLNSTVKDFMSSFHPELVY
jgi:hypothetical protein